MRAGKIIPVGLILALLTASAAGAAGFPFAGPGSCRKCHRAVHTSWEKTPMARAFAILKPGERSEMKTRAGLDPAKDYTRDPACLPCHVTGFGRAGGFISVEKTPDLTGVSCEACHGAGSEYNKVMEKRGRIYTREEVLETGLTEKVHAGCGVCHNDKSPTHTFQQAFRAEEHPWPGHEPVKLKYHTPEYKASK